MTKTAHELINLARINSSFIFDIRYATTNNVAGKILYSRACCYLHKKTADKLNAVQKELEPMGLSLKIFDGYRPLAVQRVMWAQFSDERYIANPEKGSSHNRGAAVDVTLVDASIGKELFMPSAFDDFSDAAHRHNPATNPLAAKHEQLLENIMTKHGFVGLATEWWHFDDVDADQYPLLDIPLDQLD